MWLSVIPRQLCAFPLFAVIGVNCSNSLSIILMKLVTTSGLSWDTIRSSTCHITVSCFPSTTLFVTHQSCRLIANPWLTALFVGNFQKSNAVRNVPHSAFVNATHSTSSPFLIAVHFLCMFGSNLANSLAIVPSRLACTVSSTLACMKAPGMSTAAMSLPSNASAPHGIMTD